MSFFKKELLFDFLFIGGFGLAGVVAEFYVSEEISLALFIVLGLVGCLMGIGACIFAYFFMRCKGCHKIYPLIAWGGMECCPYCGEYLD